MKDQDTYTSAPEDRSAPIGDSTSRLPKLEFTDAPWEGYRDYQPNPVPDRYIQSPGDDYFEFKEPLRTERELEDDRLREESEYQAESDRLREEADQARSRAEAEALYAELNPALENENAPILKWTNKEWRRFYPWWKRTQDNVRDYLKALQLQMHLRSLNSESERQAKATFPAVQSEDSAGPEVTDAVAPGSVVLNAAPLVSPLEVTSVTEEERVEEVQVGLEKPIAQLKDKGVIYGWINESIAAARQTLSSIGNFFQSIGLTFIFAKDFIVLHLTDALHNDRRPIPSIEPDIQPNRAFKEKMEINKDVLVVQSRPSPSEPMPVKEGKPTHSLDPVFISFRSLPDREPGAPHHETLFHPGDSVVRTVATLPLHADLLEPAVRDDEDTVIEPKNGTVVPIQPRIDAAARAAERLSARDLAAANELVADGSGHIIDAEFEDILGPELKALTDDGAHVLGVVPVPLIVDPLCEDLDDAETKAPGNAMATIPLNEAAATSIHAAANVSDDPLDPVVRDIVKNSVRATGSSRRSPTRGFFDNRPGAIGAATGVAVRFALAALETTWPHNSAVVSGFIDVAAVATGGVLGGFAGYVYQGVKNGEWTASAFKRGFVGGLIGAGATEATFLAYDQISNLVTLHAEHVRQVIVHQATTAGNTVGNALGQLVPKPQPPVGSEDWLNNLIKSDRAFNTLTPEGNRSLGDAALSALRNHDWKHVAARLADVADVKSMVLEHARHLHHHVYTKDIASLWQQAAKILDDHKDNVVRSPITDRIQDGAAWLTKRFGPSI